LSRVRHQDKMSLAAI